MGQPKNKGTAPVMSILFVLAVGVLVVIMTQNNSSTADTMERPVDKNTYDAIKAKAAKVTTRDDTLFLGYWFGMTRREFKKHSMRLIREGKIEETRHGACYMMKFSITEGCAKFKPEYFKDSLYQLIVGIEDVSSNPTSSDELLFLQVLHLYVRKHNSRPNDMEVKHLKEEPSLIGSEKTRIFITNNKEIRVTPGITDTRVIYTDLTRSLAKSRIEKKEAIEHEREVMEDI